MKNMKKINKLMIVAVSALLLAACTQTTDQKSEPVVATENSEVMKTDYLILTSNVQQIKAIAHAVSLMQQDEKYHFNSMEVVVCGQTVTELTKPEVMEPILKAVADANLKLKACGFSVNGQKVDRTQLPPEIEVVENGIAYALAKQLAGYEVLGL
jgi:intracellular sulfur oxidation DsrE/DsrF family protein